MNYADTYRPLRMNLDKSKKSLTVEECYYLLNHDVNNPSSIGKAVPMAANHPACDMQQPGGENYRVGSYYSKITNETYSWIYNTNGVHYVQRINGNGLCEIVYHGCLSLSADPKHSIEDWRAYMRVDLFCNKVPGGKLKQLIWTNGDADIGMLDVEASIATNFFTTPFFHRCQDDCAMVQMCVPDPCGCLVGEFIPLPPSERSLTNNLLDVGLKFSYRHLYYDNIRASIWSEPSTLYYQDAKGCFDSNEGFPRCIKLRIPIGNPMVDKIEVAYWKDGVWYSAEVIDKYKKYNNTQQYWFERDLSEQIIGSNYSDGDCSFDYIFCNDKLCEAIDINEMNRVEGSVPRKAQGLLSIANALGFYNYEKGSCPIDKSEIDKFKIEQECSTDNCAEQFCTIIVRAVIHNRAHNRNQFIYRKNGGDGITPDDPTDPAWFGGLNPQFDGGFEGFGYDQQFTGSPSDGTISGTTRNFIAYVEGTDYWGEMKQWKAHAGFTSLEEWLTVGNMNSTSRYNRWRRAARHGEYFYQELRIKVIQGTKGFIRLTSHHATGNDQSKSTFVIGIMDSILPYRGDSDLSSLNVDYSKEEIYFDACLPGTVELQEVFVIDDNAVDTGLAKKASAYNGYIKDKSGSPVEGAEIMVDLGAGFIKFSTTDHNGFYHFYVNPGTNNSINANVYVEQDCSSFTSVKAISMLSDAGVNTEIDDVIDNAGWNISFYATIKMLIADCNGNGISGVRVALSGSKYRVSGGDGFVRFKIRNYVTRDRKVRAIVLNHNGCFTRDCLSRCLPCLPDSLEIPTPSCYAPKPVVTLPNAILNKESSSFTRGLKSGGRYPFGLIARWRCGKLSAVNELGYLDIAKTQEKGNFGFCSFKYDGSGMILPDEVECVDIVRGENVNDYVLQWLVDKIEKTSDGKIKLTIQSLPNYNEKYFFKTNTVYQWDKNDRVEFIRNGDGSILSAVANGLLNYLTVSPFNDTLISGKTDAPADFFNQLLIEDDGRLDGITEGALIEIQRGKTCSVTPVYYGICCSLPVVNGRLVYPTGTFTTFDTYSVFRTIGNFPPQQFEHKFPSDFWGSSANVLGLSDIGRPYFVNKFENEKRYGRNITLNTPNAFNFFGDLEKTFDTPEQGDITAMLIVEGKVIIGISEHDNFLSQAANDLLRVGTDGFIRALPANAVISDAEPKVVGMYGCQYPDIGSILFGDGYATWVDNNKHCRVLHDYSSVKNISRGIVDSYFKKRCQEKETFNRSELNFLNHFRWVTGINNHNGVTYLTLKSLRHSGVNNETEPYLKPNDTIAYHPVKNEWLGFASFTPEGYSILDLFDGIGCAMLVFLHGIPYIHPIIANKWNEFFGVAVDWLVGISINKYEEKIKRPISAEVQSGEKMWFVKDVKTDQVNFRSEIPPIKWKRKEDKWNAHFLSNINSRTGLYGDNGARGYFIAALFCRDNTVDLKYGTVNPAKQTEYSELGDILVKFAVSEQSGLTENV